MPIPHWIFDQEDPPVRLTYRQWRAYGLSFDGWMTYLGLPREEQIVVEDTLEEELGERRA